MTKQPTDSEPPKLFISYSWSSRDHEAFVLKLATELRESGINVILDKWDLREGDDAPAFMERMVNDDSIQRVLLVCDREYKTKADHRKAGVGTEAQIISPSIYKSVSQNKFVAAITERDDDGDAILPAYYASRVYIDLSYESRYSEEFERLLRWVFDKPLYPKPEIGARPSYLDEEPSISLGTTAAYRRAIDAIRNKPARAEGDIEEYCSIFVANFEKFGIKDSGENFDETVVKSVNDFLPYRNEFIQIVLAMARYAPNEELLNPIHHLLESIVHYMFRPIEVSGQITTYTQFEFDNFRFVVHELFLYTIASLIRHERFDQAAYFLSSDYYAPRVEERNDDPMIPFTSFWQPMLTIHNRAQRLNDRRLGIRGQMLKERAVGAGIDFELVMQADFIASIRGDLEHTDEDYRWFPETLVNTLGRTRPFEIFARGASRAYFERMKVLLGIEKPEDLRDLMEKYATGRPPRPARWESMTVHAPTLLGFKKLATQP